MYEKHVSLACLSSLCWDPQACEWQAEVQTLQQQLDDLKAEMELEKKNSFAIPEPPTLLGLPAHPEDVSALDPKSDDTGKSPKVSMDGSDQSSCSTDVIKLEV